MVPQGQSYNYLLVFKLRNYIDDRMSHQRYHIIGFSMKSQSIFHFTVYFDSLCHLTKMFMHISFEGDFKVNDNNISNHRNRKHI